MEQQIKEIRIHTTKKFTNKLIKKFKNFYKSISDLNDFKVEYREYPKKGISDIVMGTDCEFKKIYPLILNFLNYIQKEITHKTSKGKWYTIRYGDYFISFKNCGSEVEIEI